MPWDWSRPGLWATLRSQRWGCSYLQICPWSLAPEAWCVGRHWNSPGSSRPGCGVLVPQSGGAAPLCPAPLQVRPPGHRDTTASPEQTPPLTLQHPNLPHNNPCLPTLGQTFQNIKQEYSPYQRWRHLEAVLNQSEACTLESQPHSSALTAPSSPGYSGMKKDQPSFPLWQVRIICEHLLKDYEEKIREEYEQILNTKLAEQYEPLVKCTHDQIMWRYGTRTTSYVSWSFLAYLGTRFDLKRWLLYTFCNWFVTTFQLQHGILWTCKRFFRCISYNLEDLKTFWLPQTYLSFLLIR